MASPHMQTRVSSIIWVVLGSLAMSPWCPAAATEATTVPSPPHQPSAIVAAVDRVEIVPRRISLSGRLSSVQVVATGFSADGRAHDLTRAADIAVDDPTVAAVAQGLVRPVANGEANLVVAFGRHTARVPVTVDGQSQPERISFLYGTLPALSKQDCNTGGCHGAPSGRAGFALSMDAFDPAIDRLTLTRELLNRRTNCAEPESSLLLRKPLMELPHGGGERLSRQDDAYRILVDWIGQGCRFDDDAPGLEAIRIEPDAGRVYEWPAREQQFRVEARFSDGSSRDVTTLAKFSSSDERVATIGRDGLAVGVGRGQAAISARFLDRLETVYLKFIRPDAAFRWPDIQPANLIDEAVYATLRELGIEPSPPCSDGQFIRRATLDLLGRLPTVEDVRTFVADEEPNKRSRLVDQLLEQPEFSKFWAFKWGDLLRITPERLGSAPACHKYHAWLVRAWQDNMPYDRFAMELLTASGSSLDSPTANYHRVVNTAPDAAEMTAQLFLGTRIQCAKCHNHPNDRWKQDDYYGLTAFFERIRRKRGPAQSTAPFGRIDVYDVIIYEGRSGETQHPRRKTSVAPRLPGVGELNIEPGQSRLTSLAQWLVRDDNPWFARVEVNRLWAELFGRGIVDPIDDFRDSNPPSIPALLDGLARGFVEHGYDRRWVLRTIMTSQTYATSSEPTTTNRDDTVYFSRTIPRILTAEQVMNAIGQISQRPDGYFQMPAGTLATELPMPYPSPFLASFGAPKRETSCTCEREGRPGLTHVLQLANGDYVSKKLAAHRFRAIVVPGRSDDEVLDELYSTTLARMPTAAERKIAAAYIATSPSRQEAFDDLVWAVANSREFLFRH